MKNRPIVINKNGDKVNQTDNRGSATMGSSRTDKLNAEKVALEMELAQVKE